MKNIKYIIGSCVIFTCFSCQKLDREFLVTPTKEVVDASYLNKSRQVDNLYSALPNGLDFNDNALIEAATDDAEHRNERSGFQVFNTGGWNSTTNPDGEAWTNYYKVIRQANQVIGSFGNVDLSDLQYDPAASAQAQYKTNLLDIQRWDYEARFLRAFYYFELVKRYGGVPLITTSLSLGSDFSQVKRNTLQECIDFIVSECDAAIPELPPNAALATYSSALIGKKATKFAAMALKSRVLLYAASDLFNKPEDWASGYANKDLISFNDHSSAARTIRWRAAADASKALLDSIAKYNTTTTSQVALTNNYKDLYVSNNFINTEVFLAKEIATSNTFERNNYPIGTYSQGQGFTNPSQNLVDAYEVKVGTSSSVPFDWSNPDHVKNIYNFSTPTETPTTQSLTRDPRLGFTIVTNGTAATPASSYGQTFGYTSNQYIKTYVGGADGLPKTNASKTGYYLRKYIQESLNLATNQNAVHGWILFRLAEVYLNYAEALNELGEVANAATAVNVVRKRSSVNMPDISSGLTKEEMRAKIRNERRVELAFEGHRFWDLRRWMDKSSLQAEIKGIQILGSSLTAFQTPANNKSVTVEPRSFDPEKMYLYPIKLSEVSVAKGIAQNPGW